MSAETHFEPFLHLVDVGPDRALVAWGGFWFRRDDPGGRWRVLADDDLDAVDPGPTGSMGKGGTTYVASGAGGQLREDTPEGFAAAGTVAWSAQAHLLLARVDGSTLTVTPVVVSLPDG